MSMNTRRRSRRQVTSVNHVPQPSAHVVDEVDKLRRVVRASSRFIRQLQDRGPFAPGSIYDGILTDCRRRRDHALGRLETLVQQTA